MGEIDERNGWKKKIEMWSIAEGAMTQERAEIYVVTVFGDFEVSCRFNLQSAAEIGAP